MYSISTAASTIKPIESGGKKKKKIIKCFEKKIKTLRKFAKIKTYKKKHKKKMIIIIWMYFF